MGAKTAKSLVVEEKTYDEFQKITGEMKSASVRAAGLNAVSSPLGILCGSLEPTILTARTALSLL